jgi:hypothetical protein
MEKRASGGDLKLEEPARIYRDVLDEPTRDRMPLNWAMTQNNLRTALRTFGEQKVERRTWRRPFAHIVRLSRKERATILLFNGPLPNRTREGP